MSSLSLWELLPLLSPAHSWIFNPLLFSLQIVGDAVGWGFVVRGGRPCHIQAVDPGGPAAAAGMKVLLTQGG